MKIKLYCDLPDSGMVIKPEYVWFSANPTQKIDGYTRYRLIVDLPDKYFTADAEVTADVDIIEKVKEV